MIDITVNGKKLTLDVEPDTPLLWALRDAAGLTGTKFGCGVAQCGSCTVEIDGEAMRACVVPVSAVAGKTVTTIEGLSGKAGEALRAAWAELDVPQCGYCQPGQLVSAAVLLSNIPAPSDADIDAAMAGNICRCGTYPRIRRGIKRAAELMKA